MLLQELLTQLSEDDHVRGRQFERLSKWLLENDPVYRRLIRRVWTWNEWPGRWGPDAGIDLVAEAFDGGCWAIQCKAYSEDYSIKKADVDSFLSESGRATFSYRLLVATTNRLGITAKRTVDGQERPVGLLLLADLEAAPVAWPSSFADLLPQRPQPKTPLPHCEVAVRDVVDGLADHDRGQLLMACGSGKTLVSMWVAEQLDATNTLVLVPSLSLLAQTLREWAANTSRPLRILAVCSDESVTDDDFVEHVSELGLPVTTQPEQIAHFIRAEGPGVVFATYQSSPRIADAYASASLKPFDLAIADEAHRCAGPVDGQFATIINEDLIPARRRLFMTATPRFFSKRLRKASLEETDLQVTSMDDVTHFGPVLHQLSFGEAISKEILSDYQIVVVGIDDETYEGYVRQRQFVTTDGDAILDAETLATHIAVAKTMKSYDLRRIVSFHGRVAAAKRFSEFFPRVAEWMPPTERPAGAIHASYVSGAMTSGHRDVLLGQLRHLEPEERRLIANSRCLGEGVDVPTLDGVAFIDPKNSQVDIIQAVGRAIRRSENKNVGTIILPVFLGALDEDADAVLDKSTFKPVWSVLKALRAHDDVLAQELDDLRRGLGPRGSAHIKLPEKIRFDLPQRVTAEFSHSLRLRIVCETTANWEFMFGLLEDYVGQHGTAVVPKALVVSGHTVGDWIGTQRNLFVRGALMTSRAERLAALPGWDWNPKLSNWERRRQLLLEYVKTTGNCTPPFKHKIDGIGIGQWVVDQRILYSRKALLPIQIERLKEIDGWVWDLQERRWETAYSDVKQYAAQHGHIRIPHEYRGEAGIDLASWLSAQRRVSRRHILSDERKKLLEALPGWKWPKAQPRPFDAAVEASWKSTRDALEEYLIDHDGAYPPADLRLNGVKIIWWIRGQRRSHRAGQLPPHRYESLNSMQHWVWSPYDEGWNIGLDHLRRYVEEGGNAGDVPVNLRMDDGYGLGQWVSEQTTAHRQGRLAADRVDLLGRVGGWSWTSRRSRRDAPIS